MKRLSKYAGEFLKTGYLITIWYVVLEHINPQDIILNLFVSITVWLNTAYTNTRISNLEETITKLTKKDNEVLNP